MAIPKDTSAAMAAFLARGGSVAKVPAADAATVAASSARYWQKVREMERGPVDAPEDAPGEEAFVEAATQARHAGMSESDALDVAMLRGKRGAL